MLNGSTVREWLDNAAPVKFVIGPDAYAMLCRTLADAYHACFFDADVAKFACVVLGRDHHSFNRIDGRSKATLLRLVRECR